MHNRIWTEDQLKFQGRIQRKSLPNHYDKNLMVTELRVNNLCCRNYLQ